jgi:putative transposase
MAHNQSALNELLDALRAGGDLDVIRQALTLVLQALIEAEAAQQIGASRYERTETRTTHRNGTRTRLLSTKAGDVELRIPKLREGSFFPALLEPRRRIDRALLAVVMEAYVHGTSTRKVDDLVKALGVEAAISKRAVSRICGELDQQLEAFWSRSLATPPSRMCSWTPPTSRPGSMTGRLPSGRHRHRRDHQRRPRGPRAGRW